MVSRKKPDFVYLMETKVDQSHAERLRVKIGFEGLFYVDPDRRGGGLALLWKKNNTARLLSYSKNYVDVEVAIREKVWRMTCFYGFSQRHRRREAWQLLSGLRDKSTLPWVALGDFNDLLYQREKKGGNPHPDSLLRGFGDAVYNCGLVQLPMRGHQFTWEKGKGTDRWMEERLDKVLVSTRWTTMHTEGRRHGGPKRFLFEMAWVHDDGCRGVVETAWQDSRDKGLLICQQHCGGRLMRWGGEHCHKFGDRIKQLRKEQDELRHRRDSAALAEFRDIEERLGQLEMQEDVFWRQRAKQHWLHGADCNTKFYHRYASARRRKNYIPRLKNDVGAWVEGDNMRKVVLEYYAAIFTSSNTECEDPMLDNFAPRVTSEQNTMLLRQFELEEVRSALFAMFPDKAPGPDGMNPGFYQEYWDIVGGDVSEFIVNCLNSGSLPEGLNDTNVVLIPKKDVPETVADMRPIALSNVLYRIMAKVIANRMKPLMGNLISEAQSAFIPERLITDNILIAAEVGHYLNRKQCGRKGWAALKLDMAKAYDRMEWRFLRRMLEVMGFDDQWINLLMQCVTTVQYNILINGVNSGGVTPTRGLRQGDPLSPYLFLICAEGLIYVVAKSANGWLNTWLQTNDREAEVIKQCLGRYEELSGQKVNYHKSSVCFSRNTSVEDREVVASCLQVNQAPNFGKYLGLPSFVGRKKRAVFSYIEDKIKQRISSWNKKFLTQAGKEILLKRVAQSMPTFSMSVFLIPDTVCLSFQRTMNKYWWGTGMDRGIHWKAWDKLSILKKYGGMGFKDLKNFNLAMLGKQAWRLLTSPDTLVAKVYKARYYPNTTFIDAKIGGCPSHSWRSIMAVHDMVVARVGRRIGDGKTTLIWGHPWLPDNPSPLVQTDMPVELRHAKVVGLIDEQTATGDPHILSDLFDEEDVSRILRIPVSPGYEDSWYWPDDPNGVYTVKNAYRNIMGIYDHSSGDFEKWTKMWGMKIPPKWKTFLWRAICDILPTTNNLIIKRVEVDPTCQMCGLAHENVMHTFINCDYSRHVWNISGLPITNIVVNSFPEWLTIVLTMFTEDQSAAVVALFYRLWRCRNSAVWDGTLPRPTAAWRQATAALHSYQQVVRRGSASLTAATADGSGGSTPRCYVDAGYREDTGEATYGIVLLSPEGSFLAAKNGRLSNCLSPFMAEALACKEALSWLLEKNITTVSLQIDCLQLRNAIRQRSDIIMSYVGVIVDQCRNLISSFNYVLFNHISRQINAHAHTLASLAFVQDQAMYWDVSPQTALQL
ncbi:PREDICTED: uncharacterized protein LOC109154890 [Ipomoea nil]|uniref:uncharacterized protein LOC109154890 n=1 Tax=Ipomoea nil TaxID=35883 RepID=UPI000900A660|nr:PREDICTED: uncharacterized protein LOC109154890 [Ipomoea nil]